MRLSMNMLAEWLKKYEPVCQITSKRRTISSIRIGKDELSDKNYASVDTDENNNVTVIYEKDRITVSACNINDVFNSLLNCFDYYNTMEAKMLDCLSNTNAEESILYECQNLIGPSFILSKDYKYLAITRNTGNTFINKWWEEAEKTRRVPMSLAFGMADKQVFSLFNKDYRNHVFYELEAEPYPYTLVNSYHNREREVIGVIVITSKSEITPFEMDISDILRTILERRYSDAFRNYGLTEFPRLENYFFKNLLSQKDVELNSSYIRVQYHIDKDSLFRIFVIRNADIFKNIEIYNCLDIYYQNALHVEFDNRMVILMRFKRDRIPSFDHFDSVGKRLGLCFGMSLTFDDLKMAYYYYMQADHAEKMGNAANIKGIYNFVNSAFSFLIDSKNPVVMYAKHPLVSILENSENPAGKDLLETLKIYLLNERSLNKTADILFIHKNTVLNRMHKIKDLYPIDLDDPYERLYLSISLI